MTPVFEYPSPDKEDSFQILSIVQRLRKNWQSFRWQQRLVSIFEECHLWCTWVRITEVNSPRENTWRILAPRATDIKLSSCITTLKAHFIPNMWQRFGIKCFQIISCQPLQLIIYTIKIFYMQVIKSNMETIYWNKSCNTVISLRKVTCFLSGY